jgi:hypothetical protein
MRLRDFLANLGIDPAALLDYDWPMEQTAGASQRIGGDEHPQGIRLVAKKHPDEFGIGLHGRLFGGKAPGPDGGWPTSPAPGQFTNLGGTHPVFFQGGYIVLQGNGCPGCGNGFWTESDRDRRLATGSVHHCPHCGEEREVTS